MKWFKKLDLWDYLLIAVLSYFLVQNVPNWLNQNKLIGSSPTKSLSVYDLDENPVQINLEGSNHVLIFWATWCGPCKVELQRLNNLIVNNKISAKNVILLSSEEASIVKKFILERKYKVSSYRATRELAKNFQVKGTPTVVLINDQAIIDKIWYGVSPFFSKRITSHLMLNK